jgi:SagB-type dehydrogenase family enzyme
MKTKKNNRTGDLQPIPLPEPVFERCLTLFEALKKRRTSRDIGGKKIPLQILSDILWAAAGVNRLREPFGGPGRTAASASNAQEILVYVTMEEGIYLYEPTPHMLTPVVAHDYRHLAIGAGQVGAGAGAPVRLIYVVDIERLMNADYQEPGLYDKGIQKSYYFVDTGLMAQNVNLAAAALGVSSWFHHCNKAALARELHLEPHQHALFGQTIGYED